MRSPFASIPETVRPELAERWAKEGLLPNVASGWDLFNREDEWAIYPVGLIKQLARAAGMSIEVVGLDLNEVLASDAMTETFEDAWIRSVTVIDQVHVDTVLDFIQSRGASPDDHIRIIRLASCQ